MIRRVVALALLSVGFPAVAGDWSTPKPDYLDYRLGIALWPKKSEGLAPKSVVVVSDLTCELKQTQPASRACFPTNRELSKTAAGGTMDELFLARLASCFGVERPEIPKAALA